MSSLQLIEERISELEKKVYGPEHSMQDVSNENSVIENILHANTLISSALKGREKVNTLLKRLPELNSYLDKSLEECDLQNDAKLKLLLAVETELKENLEPIKKIQSLMPVLETDKLKDVQKLSNLTLNYLKLNEEAEVLNKDVHEMYSKYNDILSNIFEVLATFDTIITAAEVAAMAKK